MEQLRQLDKSAAKRGTAAALVLGITSALILGMVLAHPLYVHITRWEREKIAPEILHLTDELMK